MKSESELLNEFVNLTEADDTMSTGPGGVNLADTEKLKSAITAMFSALGSSDAKVPATIKKVKAGQPVTVQVAVGGGAKKYTVTIIPPR